VYDLVYLKRTCGVNCVSDRDRSSGSFGSCNFFSVVCVYVCACLALKLFTFYVFDI